MDTGKLDSKGQYASEKHTCTTAVNWNNANVQYLVLSNGDNGAITMSNPKDGGRYLLILKQPSSGAAGTISSWPASVVWPAAATPTLTTTNSYVDVVALAYDGTNSKYYAAITQNYAG